MSSKFCLLFASIFCLYIPLTAAAEHLRIDVKSHPEESRSKRELIDEDVTTPMRMREDLNDVVFSRHFRRRRSATSESEIAANDEFANPVYKIHAFDQDMLIRLRPDDDLVAPSFTTTYSWKNQTTTNPTSLKQSILRKCFYKGVVIGLPSSQVSLSICDSLTGSIYTEDYHYFISPTTNTLDSDSYDSFVPHSIQRRSIGGKQKRTTEGHSSCGVNEARNIRRYKRTFLSGFEELAELSDQSRRVKRTTSEYDFEKNIVDFEIESDDEVKSRTKRSFDSRQYYIETMVVADASMVQDHGDDVEHYILSIMMEANRIFSHPSLGSAISLSVVKIMLIEDEENGPSVSSNAAHTLRDFCTWQKRHNTGNDNDPEHYDLAILLTRTDLCGDSCDTLGMAEVGSMCSSRHSCAVVQDDGLSSSYTLAHEVGHVLNMMHDDNRMCRENFVISNPGSHVMSSTIDRVDSDRPWSLCSRQAVMDFLEDGRGNCLLDRPQEAKVYPKELPGALYDVNAQCAMSFGNGATECPYMRECSRLWCQLSTGTRANQCHTRNSPRADGSPCAPGNHCMQGKCVRKGDKIPRGGGWGAWSQFGSCSRSCGGGIEMSSRQCNSPSPKNGGKYCMGSRLQFRSCNTETCPVRNGKAPQDFRSEQCAAYNGQRFPILGVNVASDWIPKYAEISAKDRCKLICQSVQTGSYITLADRVVDGTRCGPDTTNICVHGQCMPAGCDGILGSKAKYNKCGLCDTKNSRCKRVRGKYNKRLAGYNDVVTLPIGAASVKIQQKAFRKKIHDGNYLSLANSAGRYLLNGALTLSTMAKDIEVNGTVLQYTGVRVATEKIYSTMPLKEAITVQVLSLGLSGAKILPPRIKYSYYIAQLKSPRKSKTHRNPSHSSVGVVSRRTLKPEPSIQRTPSSVAPTTRETSGDRWVIGRWGKCKAYGDKKCGSGFQKRKITCKNGKKRSKGCNTLLKPHDRHPCFISNCPTVAPIGRAKLSGYNSNNGPSIVDRYRQNNERPVWNAGRWGTCSTSCGLGVKKRVVVCQTRSGRLLSNSMCSSTRQPSATHGCRLRDCR